MDSKPAGSNDVRFRVHILLETGAGERIAEIKQEDMIPDLLSDMPPGLAFQRGLETNVAVVHRLVESRIVSPLRGCVGAFLSKREGKPLFARLDEAGGWPDDGGDDAMLKKAMDSRAELMLEASL